MGRRRVELYDAENNGLLRHRGGDSREQCTTELGDTLGQIVRADVACPRVPTGKQVRHDRMDAVPAAAADLSLLRGAEVDPFWVGRSSMVRRRSGRSRATVCAMARHQRRRAAMRAPVESHVVELEPVSARPGARVLYVDGVAQSYVDMTDPTYLHFDYVRWMAAVVDAAAPRREPVRALHLGGGGFTLPRYLAATRPDSTQVVVERDAALLDLVRRELPLPQGDLRVQLADAREAIEAEPAASYDLVLADVYQGAQMPARFAGVEFAAQVARVLRPGGLYTVNLTDLPPLGYSRVEAATLRAVFPDVCLITGRAMLRGRRYGNVVLAAARKPGRLPVARLTTRALRDPVAGVVLHSAALDRFVAGAQPLRDARPPDVTAGADLGLMARYEPAARGKLSRGGENSPSLTAAQRESGEGAG